MGFSIKHSHKGWQPVGENIEYGKSYVAREISGDPQTYKNYYTLAFTVSFDVCEDTVFIALNYPYTYSRMTKYIASLPEINPRVYSQNKAETLKNTYYAIPFLTTRFPTYASANI